MRPSTNLFRAFVRNLCPAGCVLTFILSAGVRMHSQDVAPETHAPANKHEVESQVSVLDGDGGRDFATIVEQVMARYTSYVVRLQLASGAEQSIAVEAPPGGLQLEMRDMTGDNVPNDLVLTPTLVRWPLTILLNDGHDHFSVAISGVPRSWGSGEDQASRAHPGQGTAVLASSSFQAGGVANNGRLLPPQLPESSLSPAARMFTRPLDHTSRLGRAPPALVTNT
jgi:hypothetical protein